MLAAVGLTVALTACLTWTPAPPRDQWLTDTNNVRAYNGVPVIPWETELERMAQDWADSLCARHVFVHRDLAAVLSGPYGAWQSLGENIARGPAGWPQVFDAWVLSRPHFAGLIEPRWTATGVARRQCDDGNTYWVQDFAQGF